jgi:hypothetical protein
LERVVAEEEEEEEEEVQVEAGRGAGCRYFLQFKLRRQV